MDSQWENPASLLLVASVLASIVAAVTGKRVFFLFFFSFFFVFSPHLLLSASDSSGVFASIIDLYCNSYFTGRTAVLTVL